ncbi:alpha/beta fold hydrolase [Maribacter sp. 2-571]|uniref:alpha/beta fold hydrolase n=1 Tax=Maribacter sp. 2-571 TaxID=3417569 RepID=UPI003D33D342
MFNAQIERNNYTIDDNIISVLEGGEKYGAPVVFLHGIPASSELWRGTMTYLITKGFYCLAPDLSGYGETIVKNARYYDMSYMAELLVQFFHHLGLNEITLVGHDIGGGIVQILIAKHEQLFVKAVLSNCVTGSSWPIKSVTRMIKASRLGLFYWMAMAGKFKEDKLYNALSKTFHRNNLSRSEFDRIFYDGKFNKSRRIRKFQKMLRRLSSKHTSGNMELLSKVEIPVDLIWAMNDSFQPWHGPGTTLTSVLTDCEVFKIENCGHFLQLETEREYCDILFNRIAPAIK